MKKVRNPRKTAKVAMAPLPAAVRSILRRSIVAGSLGVAALPLPAAAVELPVPCAVGTCGTGPGTFVTSGAASYAISGNTGTITQTSEMATLNWSGFNISADGRVIFAQPSTTAIALNRIFQQTPSQIFGSLSTRLLADESMPGGSVYLVNPNGLVFGSTARVNAAGILASTLDISDDTFAGGLLSAIQGLRPALAAVPDADPQARLRIEAGAELATTGANGRILLASQGIENAGTVRADDGQVILAAGESVYLTASEDPALRGLVVEVGVGGTAWNQLSGTLESARGNVTVVGLAVNQEGRVSASTSVNAGGSIRLVAQDAAQITADNLTGATKYRLSALNAGTLTLGAGSRTEIRAETESTATAVRDQAQELSSIAVAGREVTLEGGAVVRAAGGNVDISAATIPGGVGTEEPDTRITIEAGATIDVAGSSSTRTVADNIVTVELRGSELADNPQQRNGALRGTTVTIDARAGTSIANISGAIAGIPETVAQRTSAGGTVTLRSNGSVLMAEGATIDVSGGVTTYEGAIVNTTQLIRADGTLVNMRDADPEATYTGVTNPFTTIKHDRWGVVERVLGQSGAHYEDGYVEGNNAGSVEIDGRTIALNGTLLGFATNGLYQRNPAADNFAAGGRLVVGAAVPFLNDYRGPDIRFSGQLPLLDLRLGLDADSPFILPTQYLASGGFTRTELYSNGTVEVPEGVDLDLLPGSVFSVRAGQIDIEGDIRAPAGTLDFASVLTVLDPGTGITVGSGVVLDVEGLWINDLETVARSLPVETLFQDAGSISFIAALPDSILAIGDDVQFLANGGGWVSRTQQVTGGEGGEITLRAGGRDSGFTVGANVALRAFGVNGAKGGVFNLAAARVAVGNDAVWAGAQEFLPVPGDASTYFNVGSALFREYGFQEVAIAATGGTLASVGDSLLVLDGTTIESVVPTLQLDGQFVAQPSGNGVGGFSHVETLPLFLRQAATLEFSVEPNSESSSSERYGDLRIGAASIVASPGSVIRLASAGGNIEVAGTLRSLAGSVELHLMPPADTAADITGFDPELGIRLLSGAVIDVSGTSIPTPNEAGLLMGSVLDGGAIALVADRGYLRVEEGASLDVSGTAASLDMATGWINQPYVRRTVAGNAGSIQLVAAETIDLNGVVAAHAGVGDTGTAAGGSLAFQLTRSNIVPPTSAPAGTEFPDNPRVVHLTATPATDEPGNGEASLSLPQIAAAGIDHLRLAADGEITVDSGLELSLREGLLLESPVLSTTGAAPVRLTAPYILLGGINQVSVTPVAGDATLDIAARFIDLRGFLTLRNFGNVVLSSSGDIRLRGAVVTGELTGRLDSESDVALRAAQVYAATGTNYTFNAAASRVTIEQQGERPAAPLSAASSLTINAREIVQSGTLVAPFGTITLNGAESVTLGEGSLTSVSAAGLVIPYGETTTGGKEWWYFGAGGEVVADVPDSRINLEGSDVVMTDGATVDLSGGGDLYAFEFIKGTGGTVDALASNRTDLFAILPLQDSPFGPYDDAEYNDSHLRVGDSVYLSGGAGLAAGSYALLPARYALLPGAMLISPTAYTDMLPGVSSALSDGTPVIAGYRTFADTGLGGTRYDGFAVYPGSWGRELAEYLDTYASTYQYFPDSVRQVADAGSLSLLPQAHLQALAQVMSSGAEGGRNAAIDISAVNLRVVPQVVEDGSGDVQLEDSVLSSWNAGSLLIGGTRLAGGAQVTPAATSVTVAAGATVAADEIILVGLEGVTVDGTVTTLADTAAELESRTLTLAGTGSSGAAVIAVSDLNAIEVERAQETGIFPGAATVAGTLLTHNGLTIDAPGGALLTGAMGGTGARWNLAADHLAFDAVPVPGQLTVTPALRAALAAAAAVRFESRGDLDFIDGGAVGAESIGELTLAAARLRNLSGENVEITAGNFVLEGLGTGDAIPGDPAAGEFVLQGRNIGLTGQSLAVSGFSTVRLGASEQIAVRDTGTLLVGGDLVLDAARFTMGSGADSLLAASGLVQMGSVAASGALPSLELGGGLTVRGNDIVTNARIVAPSGYLSFEATRNLSIGAGAAFDLSGTPIVVAGVSADSPGGTLHLGAGSDLAVAAGAMLAVNGAGDQGAGRVLVMAGGNVDFSGTASGIAAAGGGEFDLRANQLSDFAGLNALLQQGGFTGAQRIRVAQGDLTLAAGTVTTAHDVEIVTGAGTVSVRGIVSAPSGGERSTLRLYGTNVVLEAGAELHADAAGPATRGGLIEIGAASGTVDLRAGSVVTTTGQESGRLLLRAAAVGADEIAIDGLAADLTQAGAVTLEAVLPAFALTAAPTAADYASMRTAAETYVTAAEGTIAARLGSGYTLVPGIEIQYTGDLTLPALELGAWRFGSAAAPAALTVRSTGAINVAGNISDGFTVTGSGTTERVVLTGTPTIPDRSATLRMTAGADLASPDPLAVDRNAAADLTLAAGRIVRTATGDLSLVASQDVVFATGASAYTVGTAALPTVLLTTTPAGGSMTFAHDGGRLSIAAGRDVVGASLQRTVTAWQPRRVTTDDLTQWAVDLRSFNWNTGALGGGDLVVTAGRDINQLSAAAAESASENAVSGVMDYFGGGAVRLTAGRDINSGLFYVGRNDGNFHADGRIASNSAWVDSGGNPVGALLAMGESTVSLYGRTGVVLGAAVNPTIFGQDIAGRQPYFFTYGENASIDLLAAAGDVILQQRARASVAPFFGTATINDQAASILPPSMVLTALSGDIVSTMNASLAPSDRGSLELFAAGSMTGFRLLMSDVQATGVATPLNPSVGLNRNIYTAGVVTDASASARHAGDPVPVRITAGEDLAGVTIAVPKALELTAGRDIVNVNIAAQNLGPADVTQLTAGRDLVFNAGGVGAIAVGGPGRLDIIAGRNVDLGLSNGVFTSGKLDNPNITSESGADLTILAGFAPGWDVRAFVEELVLPSSELSEELIAYVEPFAGNATTGTGKTALSAGQQLSVDEAVALFLALPDDLQRPLVLKQFYAALAESGRQANSVPEAGYSLGYAAIDALLPGNRSEANPYEGTLSLDFSRIYTLAGGNINLLTPGGSLNVGLAEPPTGLSAKEPGELGIVAQKAGNVSIFTDGDVLVNSSRIFTLLGGDIVIWSTLGNIDAGRGAKSSLSIPPPAVLIDDQGNVTLDLSGAVAGSGIRTINTDSGVEPGDVDLIAPAGFVNAGDAGIGSAGNINIAANRVLGVDNIQVGGSASGVPAATSGLAASLSGVAAVGGAGDTVADATVREESTGQNEQAAPLTESALSWLEVFIIGLGEETCRQDDLECLRRQQ